MPGPSIQFDRVGLALGSTPILEEVSFTVAAGSIHCVVGANGGGKTSLIRALLGQMPHTGRISIGWQDNRVIGYVPQTLDFDRSLPVTVLDFMGLATQRRPVFFGVGRRQRDEIIRRLTELGLADRLHARLGSLSGGERQRALLAQALIPQPGLLVLDEPATGLDLSGRDILERTIKGFAAAGGTVVWINHDIVQVNGIADRLTYINRRVLLDGPPREVLAGGVAAQLFPTLNVAQRGVA